MSREELVRLVDIDFPETGEITEEVREETKKESYRFRGGVRLSNGLFWTTKEYEETRKEVLNLPIP